VFKRQIKLALTILFLLLAGTASAAPSTSASLPSKPKVFLILIDKVTWQDLNAAKTPTIKKLINKGATGLLSNHTALSLTKTGRSYVTISAGNRSTAGLGVNLALTKDEKFKELTATSLYKQRYRQTPGTAQVLHLALPAQERANLLLNYGAQPALLGDVLQKNKVATAVYGNADLDAKENLFREAALIAANRQGQVPYGDVSSRNHKPAATAPFGLITNYNFIFKQLKKELNKARFFVIETGDFRRIDAFQKYTNETVTKAYKQAALKRLDRFLQLLLKEEPLTQAVYLLVAPSPPLTEQLQKVQQLTPIIMTGTSVSSGSLTSSSTKRVAIVTSTDIAPTILAFFKLPTPYQMTGRPMQVSQPKLTPKQLEQANADYMLADLVASPAIITYIIWQSLALLLVLLVMTSRLKQIQAWRRLSQICLLAALALPLAYLMAPLLPYQTPIGYIGAVLLFTYALVLLALAGEKLVRHGSLLVAAGATVLFIVINLLAGSYTDLRSVFGYSPIVAGRFYGLGNQTFSLLIPAFFVFLALVLDSFSLAGLKKGLKPAVLALFLSLIFLIGYPALGANTGGLITAATAFTVAFFTFFYQSIKPWQLVIILLAAVLFLSLFVLADIYLLPTPTHMGKTALMVASGGWEQLGIIVKRKALANFRIFKYTSWSYLIVTVIGLLLWQWLTQTDFGQINLFQKYRYLKKSLGVTLVAGLVGAAVNDSGISIPALMLGYFLSAVFYLILGEYSAAKVEVQALSTEVGGSTTEKEVPESEGAPHPLRPGRKFP